MNLKKFYENIKKEHLFVFLVILVSLILFNYFNFEYTGLTVSQDSCYDKGYSCCSPSLGQGNYYFSLDNTCSQDQECWDYCQNSEQKQGGLITTGATFKESVNDFFDEFKKVISGIFKRNAVGSGLGGSSDDKCNSKPGKQNPIGRECSGMQEQDCLFSAPICDWDEGSCFGTGYTCEAALTQLECGVDGYALLCDWQTSQPHAQQDTTPPTVEPYPQTQLATNQNNFNTAANIILKFSETMDKNSIESAFSLRNPQNQEVDGSKIWIQQIIPDTAFAFNPTEDLQEGTTYIIKVTISAKDLFGNNLANEFSFEFTTSSSGGQDNQQDNSQGERRLSAPGITKIKLDQGGILLTWETTSIDYISASAVLEKNKITGDTIKETFNNAINFFKRLFGFQTVGINPEDIKGFKIYRFTELFPDDPIYLEKANACNTQGICSYLDTRTLTNDVTYYYKIRAVDNNNVEGTLSQQVEIKYEIIGQQASNIPTAPSDLQATVVSSAQINLQWQDNSENEQGFKIERSPSSTFIPIQETLTTGPNTITYGNYGLTPASTNWYRVKAFNADGESEYSNSASATTTSSQPPIIVDVQAPTSRIINPINNRIYSNFNQLGGAILGTASDNSGISKVKLYFKNLNTTKYWNNNNYIAQKTLLSASRDISAYGTDYGWYYNLPPESTFVNDNMYEVCSIASDINLPINNVQPQPDCINFTYATTITPPPPPPATTENCINVVDDDGDLVRDSLDRDCPATGNSVVLTGINASEKKPYEDSNFEVQCKIAVAGADLDDAEPCVIVNISHLKQPKSKLCEFLTRSTNNLRFNCEADAINPAKTSEDRLISCQIDTTKCYGDPQATATNKAKNVAQAYINVTTPSLCSRITGISRINIINVDMDDKEYKANEKIKPKVEIDNLDNEDLNITTEAYLYDINKKQSLVKAEKSKLIEEGTETQDINLELITPQVSESKFKIYFKTYLENEEDEICIVSSKTIDIKPSLTRTSAFCGDGVLGGNEKCDDGNTQNNDGCSSVCNLEDNATTICTSGQTRACGLDIGICKKGVQTCTNGAWGACAGEISPSQEICNDLMDNNCNGLTDCSDFACSTSQTCIGTSALDDIDRDGLLDEWELSYFGNLNVQSGEDDFDNDGFTNAQEYAKNTDPTDSSSAPKKSSALTIAIIVVLILVVAGVLVWLFALRPKKPVAGLPPTRTNIKITPSGKVNPALSGYIKTSLQKGYTRQQIKNALSVKGWDEKEIDDAFKYFR